MRNKEKCEECQHKHIGQRRMNSRVTEGKKRNRGYQESLSVPEGSDVVKVVLIAQNEQMKSLIKIGIMLEPSPGEWI